MGRRDLAPHYRLSAGIHTAPCRPHPSGTSLHERYGDAILGKLSGLLESISLSL